jgi:hypothetical protein
MLISGRTRLGQEYCFGGLRRLVLGSRARSAAFHDRTVAGRARISIMPRKQMFDQRLDSAVTLAAQLGVFVEGQILRAANFLRLEQRGRSVASELVEFLTLRVFRHAFRFYGTPRHTQGYFGTISGLRRRCVPPSLRKQRFCGPNGTAAHGAGGARVPVNRSAKTPRGFGILLVSRRGTQEVRERSAKPLCVGSIPTRASKMSLDYQ